MNHDPFPNGRDQSDFIGELGDAIRQNPVPAALVGAGFLWLLMGGRDVLLGGASHSLLSGMGDGTRRGGRAAYRGARYAAEQASEGVGRMAESAAQLGSRISDGVSGAAGAVSGAAGNVAEQVTHAVSETAERVSSAAREEAEPDDSSKNRETSVARHMQDSLADLLAQQPLLLGAVGLAIGAGIAASMPGSEAENRLMGATADAARSRGEALWQEAKKRGTDIASRGLDEAKERGLTPEAAANVARTITSKVSSVTENAGRDIVDRIKG